MDFGEREREVAERRTEESDQKEKGKEDEELGDRFLLADSGGQASYEGQS